MGDVMVSTVLNGLAGLGAGLRRTVNERALSVTTDPFLATRGQVALYRAYYQNELYDDERIWAPYKRRYRLPRSLRSIYNPTKRAVDWYPGHVYPGVWTEDGRPLPDGTPHLVPFPADVLDQRPELVSAALQYLTWGNWRTAANRYVREAAMVGSVFVEVVDDLDRMKVYPEIRPIEDVVALKLDVSGNVKSYTIAYPALDQDGPFTFVKSVDRDSITIQRNFQTTSQTPNPYGFVPAVWVKHRDTGGLFGEPVIAGVLPKLDELNGLITSIHNYVRRLQKSPFIIWTMANIAPAMSSTSDKTADSTDGQLSGDEADWLIGKDANGRVENLMQAVPIGDAGVRVDKLMEEIEADLPETVMDKQLRQMSQVTAPGASRMMSDVVAKLNEAQTNDDAGLVKLIQMGVAIAGWRLGTGAWGVPSGVSREQAKFAGFGLDSFPAGDLDLSLEPRPLFAPTEAEQVAMLVQKMGIIGQHQTLVEAGYDEATIAEIEGNEAATQTRLATAAANAFNAGAVS